MYLWATLSINGICDVFMTLTILTRHGWSRVFYSWLQLLGTWTPVGQVADRSQPHIITHRLLVVSVDGLVVWNSMGLSSKIAKFQSTVPTEQWTKLVRLMEKRGYTGDYTTPCCRHYQSPLWEWWWTSIVECDFIVFFPRKINGIVVHRHAWFPA